jgi:proteasome lid subunit RPN8/RPN11
VKILIANRAWKTIFVQTAKKKRRKQMKNRKHKSPESTKTQIRANLRQRTQRSSWRVERNQREKPALRFSPTAWAKLLHFRDKSDNEVGGFGVTDADDLLFVKEFVTVKQEVTCVSVEFEDEAVADFFDTQVDLGRKPEQFARIWLHTHPGDSPEPSGTDEETFERVFGNCQWAVMFVVAENNRTYAKLSFNVGPGGQVLIPTQIDYSQEFGSSDRELWDTEYAANVKAIEWLPDRSNAESNSGDHDLSDYDLAYEFLDEFESMEPEERQFTLDELAERPELWDEEEVTIL